MLLLTFIRITPHTPPRPPHDITYISAKPAGSASASAAVVLVFATLAHPSMGAALLFSDRAQAPPALVVLRVMMFLSESTGHRVGSRARPVVSLVGPGTRARPRTVVLVFAVVLHPERGGGSKSSGGPKRGSWHIGVVSFVGARA